MRSLLKLVFLLGPLPCLVASTVEVVAGCSETPGPTVVHTLTQYGTAMCEWAFASAGPTSVLAQSISGRGFSGYALASVNDDVLLTVFGGGGGGLLLPCLVTSGSGSASLDGVSAADSAATCSVVPVGQTIPFVFGTEMTLHLTLGALGGGAPYQWGGGSARLEGFRFFDEAGNPMADATYTLVTSAVPEPATLSVTALELLGTAAIWAGRRRRG